MRLFSIAFQLSKTEIYEVAIKETHMYNPATKTHYADGVEFSHSAYMFCRNKKDFTRCGQCQDEFTRNYKVARRFCDKYEPKHLHRITEEEYNEIVSDIGCLKEAYNYVEVVSEDGWKSPSFLQMKELSMLPLKKN